MLPLIRLLIIAAAAAAILGTLIGLLAPFWPTIELVNHFRPVLLIGSLVLLIAAILIAHRGAIVLAGAATVLNLALALATLAFAAKTAPDASLKILTFNLFVSNRTPQAALAFLQAQDADIVLLQEVDARLEGLILPGLSDRYPHVFSCATRNCGLVLLSKVPWADVNSRDRGGGAPAIISARFDEGGRRYTVTNAHLAFPLQPLWQQAQIEWLAHYVSSAEGTQILAGDFNLSPFSWMLNRLSYAAGLLRHAGSGASWPAFGPFSFVLIDNLLSTPDVRSKAVTYGPRSTGSDHRPVLFEVAFDPS